MEKKLVRNIPNKMIGGVAAGLADYAGIDITLVRLLFVVATFFQGSGLLVYVIMWIAMPAGPPAAVYSDYSNAADRADPGFGASQEGFAGNQPSPKSPRSESNSTALIGWILVGFGVYFLGREFLQPWLYQFFYWFNFGRIWPVVFIIVGVLIITSASRKQASPAAPPPASPSPDSAPASSGPPPPSPGSPASPAASAPSSASPGSPASPAASAPKSSPGFEGPPKAPASPGSPAPPAASTPPPSSTLSPPTASTETEHGEPPASSTLPPPASSDPDNKPKPE